MWTIFLKEISFFFSSIMGYLTIGIFLLMMGLFLWVFPDTSLLNYEAASLESFFTLAPWIFMFLIPAITMRSFADEKRAGTIELLLTKPLTEWQIVGGKFLGSYGLFLLAILPTFIYYISIYMLGAPKGNIDMGATNGSYIGLILLGAVFTAIGVFTSSITNNQIVAFIIGVFFCFMFFIAFQYLSFIPAFIGKWDYFIQLFGIDAHYTSISRGVVDTRDLLYFISLVFVFLLFTKTVLDARKWS